MTLGVRVLRTGVLLALLASPLAGCKSSQTAGSGGTPASRAAGSAPATTAAPSPGSSGSAGSCGGASDPRLQSVTLAADSSSLTATWTSTGTDKAAVAIWVVTVSEGKNDYQLTVKATNGVAQSYVFNADVAAQTDVHQPGGLTVTPTGARESFPWADLPGIGSDFTWNAVLNIDGSDVAYCPADLTFLAFRH